MTKLECKNSRKWFNAFAPRCNFVLEIDKHKVGKGLFTARPDS